MLGVCYYETGLYEQAATFCGKAAELAPKNSEVLSSLGDIYARNGEPYNAINAYKQCGVRRPTIIRL